MVGAVTPITEVRPHTGTMVASRRPAQGVGSVGVLMPALLTIGRAGVIRPGGG